MGTVVVPLFHLIGPGTAIPLEDYFSTGANNILTKMSYVHSLSQNLKLYRSVSDLYDPQGIEYNMS